MKNILIALFILFFSANAIEYKNVTDLYTDQTPAFEAAQKANEPRYECRDTVSTWNTVNNIACINAHGKSEVSEMILLQQVSYISLAVAAFFSLLLFYIYVKRSKGNKILISWEIVALIIGAILIIVAYEKQIGVGLNMFRPTQVIIGYFVLVSIPIIYFLTRSILTLMYEKLKGKTIDSINNAKNTVKETLKDTEQTIKRGSTSDELLKWLELKEKGIITEEEFKKRKEDLLK